MIYVDDIQREIQARTYKLLRVRLDAMLTELRYHSPQDTDEYLRELVRDVAAGELAREFRHLPPCEKLDRYRQAHRFVLGRWVRGE